MDTLIICVLQGVFCFSTLKTVTQLALCQTHCVTAKQWAKCHVLNSWHRPELCESWVHCVSAILRHDSGVNKCPSSNLLLVAGRASGCRDPDCESQNARAIECRIPHVGTVTVRHSKLPGGRVYRRCPSGISVRPRRCPSGILVRPERTDGARAEFQ